MSEGRRAKVGKEKTNGKGEGEWVGKEISTSFYVSMFVYLACDIAFAVSGWVSVSALPEH